MSEPTVIVNGIGKKYNVNKPRGGKDLKDILSSPVSLRKKRKDELWAAKDISFELYKGDTLAIVGRNGAGKSTLLKMLSRVIEPTGGGAVLKGRNASLLEVGTGFHPDLSGKENVYFNGALLGMSKSEIASKYKEIVDFSEVGDFIDMPIKRYSSGMKVRLAFSVAATLDADIMIIDEALSVGDVAFRQKSLEKMKRAAFEGRTVLFVTHSMSSAQDLCNKAMYLKDGKNVGFGEVNEIIDLYLGQTRTDLGVEWNSSQSPAPDKKLNVTPESIKIANKSASKKAKEISYGDDIKVEIVANVKHPHDKVAIGVSIFDESGRRIFRTSHKDSKNSSGSLKKGKNKLSLSMPSDFLLPGLYVVALDVDDGSEWIIKPSATDARVGFLLKQPEEFQFWNPSRDAVIKPRLDWEIK